MIVENGDGMEKKIKKHRVKSKLSGLSRAIMVGLSFLLQIALMFVMVYYMQFHAIWLYFVIEVVSIILRKQLYINDKKVLDYYCAGAAGGRLFAVLYVGQETDEQQRVPVVP